MRKIHEWYDKEKINDVKYLVIHLRYVACLEIGFEGAVATNVAGPAMEAPAEWVGVAERHLDALDAQGLKHLDDGHLVAIDDDAFGVEHEHVHRQPLGRHPERMTWDRRPKKEKRRKKNLYHPLSQVLNFQLQHDTRWWQQKCDWQPLKIWNN